MRVLVAMSGGVDSSVAAALLVEQGHEVVGATLKLWGGASDTGCCSVADVDDARRVAQQLGIDHYVFNFTEEFQANVVDPYVRSHELGLTPNPCLECNRHLKFDRLIERADQLGFDAVATGHHARIEQDEDGQWQLLRGADEAKDQSYVLYVMGQSQLARTVLPVGGMTKAEVRSHAERLGLRTASKPDSQDTCFITTDGGREAFLGERIPLREAKLVDTSGKVRGTVAAAELVTVGQRRGLQLFDEGKKWFALDVNTSEGVVTVGEVDELMCSVQQLHTLTFVNQSPNSDELLQIQTSAHGNLTPGHLIDGEVHYATPIRKVAPGQSVVFYRDNAVVGGGIVQSTLR